MNQDKSVGWSRREALRAGLLGGAGLLLGGCAAGAGRSGRPGAGAGGRSFRFVHMTDMHVQPELRAGEGWAAALEHAKQHQPQLILTGGDHVMDTFGQWPDRPPVVWEVYQQTLREHAPRVPVYPTLGNHDIFGWGVPDKVPEAAAGYGKAMYLDRMRLKKTYYSFDAGGWHFVVLDNVQRRGKGYVGELDGEQAEWLKADLAKNEKPVLVSTHIPLLSATCLFDGERFKKEAYDVPDSYMHANVRPLLELLRLNNVKLCVSGHIHQVDRVDYLGMSFVCDGAVCGAWWKGPNAGFPEGYGVFDLKPDGTFEHQYVTYGWQPAKA